LTLIAAGTLHLTNNDFGHTGIDIGIRGNGNLRIGASRRM